MLVEYKQINFSLLIFMDFAYYFTWVSDRDHSMIDILENNTNQ